MLTNSQILCQFYKRQYRKNVGNLRKPGKVKKIKGNKKLKSKKWRFICLIHSTMDRKVSSSQASVFRCCFIVLRQCRESRFLVFISQHFSKTRLLNVYELRNKFELNITRNVFGGGVLSHVMQIKAVFEQELISALQFTTEPCYSFYSRFLRFCYHHYASPETYIKNLVLYSKWILLLQRKWKL